MRRTCLLLAAVLSFCAVCRAGDDPNQGEVMNFSLLDYKGKYHELRRTDARAVVLFFTENGCPVARQSIDKLKKLRSHFSDKGVAVWMVNSNPQDDRESIKKEAEDFKEDPLPVLIDDTQQIARLLGVNRTGETICIDTSDWTVFYRGAIDDQLVEGAQKPEPTARYVRNAIEELLAGKKIERPKTSGRGCLITFDPAGSPISYSREIAPVLQSKCVGCHSPGNIAPFALSSYQKVMGHGEMIREVLATCRMPPWDADPSYGHFKNDRSLSLAQKKLLLRWLDQGMPRGDGPDPLAQTVPTVPDWPLGPPDYIVKLPVPEQIPATGVFDYRYVDIPSPITNDVWLSAAVMRPDNRRVVHHLIVRANYDKTPKRAKDDVFLSGWAPGFDGMSYPSGTGKFLGKGATLNFELHYTADGRPETDQSELGLYLAKSQPKLALQTRAAYNKDFVVPANEAEASSYAVYGFQEDSMLYDLAPHMHLRGSWFKYEALYPDGERETLLSVPHYDFNWQTIYRLAEPKKMPAGTWILCTGGFDNSGRNPSNPNPGKRVRWGDQSFDEMFIGFMDAATLPPAGGSTGKQARRDTADAPILGQ
ncbi:MAG TPA: redoxin domain-containing protein [Verrucomicrobiae bacterium]|nr:redoxin domain-containing protein [Verrucomicrobiae bacterium]